MFSKELFEYLDNSFSYKGSKYKISSVNFFSLLLIIIKSIEVSFKSLKESKVNKSFNIFDLIV